MPQKCAAGKARNWAASWISLRCAVGSRITWFEKHADMAAMQQRTCACRHGDLAANQQSCAAHQSTQNCRPICCLASMVTRGTAAHAWFDRQLWAVGRSQHALLPAHPQEDSSSWCGGKTSRPFSYLPPVPSVLCLRLTPTSAT